jgi:hypothetical protein
MSHYVSTKPFYILTGVPNPNQNFMYSANVVGNEIMAPDTYGLEEFDTEEELSQRVDELKGEAGWYWKCTNRIPYPPNPNEWSIDDCEE